MPPTRPTAPAAVENPDELIAIQHPDVDAKGVATRGQLRDLWAARGWSEAADTEPEAVAAAAVESLASVTAPAETALPDTSSQTGS